MAITSTTVNPASGQRGFSLIELLVALVIFATMATIAYTGLGAVTRSYETLDARERELAALGRVLSSLERDLRAVALRPVRDGEGRTLPPLVGQVDALELSSYGRGRYVGVDLGLVERIGYVRDADGLHRLRWPALDRAQSSAPEQRRVLTDIGAFRLRFLDRNGRWHPQWPALQVAADEVLPRAVEFTLVHERLGELHRLIELPEAREP